MKWKYHKEALKTVGGLLLIIIIGTLALSSLLVVAHFGGLFGFAAFVLIMGFIFMYVYSYYDAKRGDGRNWFNE